MNSITCTITHITNDENLALLTLDSQVGKLYALILHTPEYYQKGDRINAIFKPTQVLLSVTKPCISTHNCFSGTITHIQRDEILSLVCLNESIYAMISTRDLENLALSEGHLCFGVSILVIFS